MVFQTHPPPTAQTDHGIGVKFGMKGPQGYLSRLIGAIFDISPLSRATGVWGGTPRGKNHDKFFIKILIFFDGI